MPVTVLINGIVQWFRGALSLASPPASPTAPSASPPVDHFDPAQTSYARLIHTRCAGHVKLDPVADLAVVCESLPPLQLPTNFVESVHRKEALRAQYHTRLRDALRQVGLKPHALAAGPEACFAALGQALQQRTARAPAAPTYEDTTRQLLSFIAACVNSHPSPLWRYHAALCYVTAVSGMTSAYLCVLDASCPFVQMALSAN